jgi:hypothetical protein
MWAPNWAHTLLCSSNASAKTSRKMSKLFKIDEHFSNMGVNHDTICHVSNVPINLTRDASSGWRVDCKIIIIQM